MPSITLDVQAAKLVSKFGSGYGVSDDGKWSITFDVRLPWPERLELGTGEEPGELDMRLTFQVVDAELVEWATGLTKDIEDTLKSSDRDKLCGTVSYQKAWEERGGIYRRPAIILFHIHTPPDVMASMVRFAENGRFVKTVTVDVRGMTYGYAPDGSEKRWPDNADRNMLPIVNVSYALTLLEQPDEKPDPGEPNTPVGADLVPVLKETLKWLKGAVWLLAAIAGALVLKGCS